MKSLSFSKPHLIIMIGIPGAGKSFFAEHFAETFKAPIISFHRFHQELFDSPNFNNEYMDIINRVADYMMSEIFKTRQTIIYDGRTGSRAERMAITKKSRDAGYEPLFIWVQTEPLTAKKRATKFTPNKPTLTSEQFDSELKRFNIPNPSEKAVVISGKHTYASQLRIVLKRLVEPRTPIIKPPEPVRRPISRNVLIR